MDDETGEKIPYAHTNSNTRPNTSYYYYYYYYYSHPGTNAYPNSKARTNADMHSNTNLNERIEAYKVLIDACREHMVWEDRKASFNIENVTYKQIEKEYRKFSLVHHPDKGGDEKIFQAGSGSWTDLKNKLTADGCTLENLKGITEPLLTHLKTHPPQ